MNRLSHSAMRTYGECGQKYFFHYREKLRETVKSGALCFGTAIDKALEGWVANPGWDLQAAKAAFEAVWSKQDINGRMVSLMDSLLVVYAATDFDVELLSEDDLRWLAAKQEELVPELGGSVEEAYKQCASFKKQRLFRHFKDTENKFHNICNWLSLRQKGFLMLEAYEREVKSRITKVVALQKSISLVNDQGDSLIGYPDLVCHWDGSEAPIVIDFKTSSRAYEEDSVKVSPQLTIYAHALGLNKAGFVVFSKHMHKNRLKTCERCGYDGSGSRAKTCTDESQGGRCGGAWKEVIRPSASVQIIIDDIPARTQEVVLQNIEAINAALKAEVFPRNFNSCKTGYGLCPYYSLCWKGSSEGLETVE